MSETITDPKLFEIPSLPDIDLQGRMEIVYSSHGFMPHTKDELNEVISIDAFSAREGGVARHLNEVLIHQKTKANTINPSQAVRSITQEYVWYAKQAHQDSAELLLLHSQSKDMLSPKEVLGEYLQDLVIESGTEVSALPGVRQLVRHIDLATFERTGLSSVPSGDVLKKRDRVRGTQGSRKILDVYSPGQLDNQMQDYIERQLDSITIRELRIGPKPIIESAVDASISRFDYWIKVLRASKAHMLARPIAQRAIDSLMSPEKKVT